MSQTTISIKITHNSAPTDATLVVFSDRDETFGVRRLDTGQDVVFVNTPLVRTGVGTYAYTFEDPAYDLIYQYSIKYVISGKDFYAGGYENGTKSEGMGDLSYIDDIISEVKVRARLDQIDNLLTNPINAEIEFAIFDALQDINSCPPQTFFTLDWVWDGGDPRWRRLLILGATRNTLQTLLHDWTQNGIDAKVGEGALEIPNRLESIRSLLEYLTEDFDKKLERLKATSQKFVKHAYAQRQSLIKQMPRTLISRITRLTRLR